MLQAVVHVNFGDPSRQEHALGDISNILKEDPAANIEVVCHGEGIQLVQQARTKHADKVKSLAEQGVRFAACENTMEKESIEKSALVPGTATVPSGAAEVIAKQSEGYSYFRP